MAIEAQIAAFEGGKLRVLASGEESREAVLALPLSRLLVKLLRVSAEEDPVTVATPLLQGQSPFPDEPLTVSCETVCEEESGRVVIAAALPESAADDIGEALDAAKLNVVRIDSLALGQLRGVWNALGESNGRRMVVLRSADCLSLFVLDGDRPSAIRAIVDSAEIRREVMLSLLEAEDFGGSRKLEEIVVVQSEPEPAAEGAESTEASEAAAAEEVEKPALDVQEEVLKAFAPVRTLTVGRDAALVGVQERSEDAGALNALPESWRELLEETRFKAKLVKYLVIAGGLWALIMVVLFGVPLVFGFMTDYQKGLSKQHARQYQEVSAMKEKVMLVKKYSDHARGALEIMKAISDRLPEGVTLTSWTYKRDEGVRVTGESDTAEATYAFKDAIDEMAEGEGGEKIFGTVVLNGPNASKGGFRFDLDCQYKTEEDE